MSLTFQPPIPFYALRGMKLLILYANLFPFTRKSAYRHPAKRTCGGCQNVCLGMQAFSPALSQRAGEQLPFATADILNHHILLFF